MAEYRVGSLIQISLRIVRLDISRSDTDVNKTRGIKVDPRKQKKNSQVTKLSQAESSETTNRLTDMSENFIQCTKIQGMIPKC